MKSIKSIIEALLIVSEHGLSINDIKGGIIDADNKDIKENIDLLREEYDSPERAFNIAEIAGKYRIVTKPEYLQWINNLYKKETEKLSSPALETLAIIAYKQPVTRAETESIRGVGVGGVLKTLLDKDLVLVKGRKEVIGRPLLYATTDKFLEIFGLNSLDDLPILKDFSEDDLEYGQPQETVEMESGETKDEGRETIDEGDTKDEGREAKDEVEPEDTKDEGREVKDEVELEDTKDEGTIEEEIKDTKEIEEKEEENKETQAQETVDPQ
ncbi:MAG: SMC-Scp complex subunit ScpB [Candidatus Aadella gelida]|nr:SMC-Scp complex subunit ScpB [Candidatus Aadella gelida]